MNTIIFSEYVEESPNIWLHITISERELEQLNRYMIWGVVNDPE